MDAPSHSLNVPFRPSPKFRLWYGLTALLVVLVIACSYAIFALFAVVPSVIHIAVAVVTVVVFALFLAWTALYYASMQYSSGTTSRVAARGLVPADRDRTVNRITNINVRQGPLMRALGISNLAVQTVGFSGQMTPELVLEAMEHAEEFRRDDPVASPAGGGRRRDRQRCGGPAPRPARDRPHDPRRTAPDPRPPRGTALTGKVFTGRGAWREHVPQTPAR